MSFSWERIGRGCLIAAPIGLILMVVGSKEDLRPKSGDTAQRPPTKSAPAAIPQWQPATIAELQAEAAGGSWEAMELLALRYASGDGGARRDHAKAVDLYLAAIRIHAAKAAEWERKAAAGGSDRAHANTVANMSHIFASDLCVKIGDLYLAGGYGLPLDPTRAAYWYCRAEEHGHHPNAARRLRTLQADLPGIEAFCGVYDDEH